MFLTIESINERMDKTADDRLVQDGLPEGVNEGKVEMGNFYISVVQSTQLSIRKFFIYSI